MNDFVAICERAYNNEQILKMEKTILGKLEWYITVPTPYVFLSRYIKASIPENDVSIDHEFCYTVYTENVPYLI